MTTRIVTVHGAKGGLGTSLIAANLAITWAQGTKQPVCLVDLDLFRGGSQASFFDLEGDRTHLGTLMQAGLPTGDLLDAHVLKHRSGVHLLAAPPADTPVDVPPEFWFRLTQLYPHVVVDASIPNLPEHMLDATSALVLPVIPEINALQQTRWFLKRLQHLRFPPQRLVLVLNMVGLTGDIPKSDMEDILGKPFTVELPYVPAEALSSVNRGQPLALTRSVLGSAFPPLAKQVLSLPPLELKPLSTAPKAPPQTAKPIQPIMPEVVPPPAAQVLSMPQDEYRELKSRLHKRLVSELKLQQLDPSAQTNPEQQTQLREKVTDKIAKLLDEEAVAIASRSERMRVIQELVQEALGLGPLEDLLADPQISEVMVNGPHQIWVERGGKLMLTDRHFTDERQLRVIIDRIVAPIGRRVDESSPMVDARLPDGSRVNIITPPLALTGSTITIRKFPSDRMTIDDYLRFGSLSPEMAEFLAGCVKARLNLFISGGTGSGKTTLLNILSSFIPDGERIITIEDAAELKLHQRHVISLESRPPNIEGVGAIHIRDLVRNSLRMRPDRIIVGEVRGGEALDMLQAMNTGHDGSLATGHANTPRDALARLETMVLMAGVDLPVRAIREQVASAVHLVIQQARLKDGSRKITKITEITGMEGDVIALQDIFSFEQTGMTEEGRVAGRFVASPFPPKLLQSFSHHGLPIPSAFRPK